MFKFVGYLAKVIKEFIKHFLVTKNSSYTSMFNLIMEKLDIIYDETSSARKVTNITFLLIKKIPIYFFKNYVLLSFHNKHKNYFFKKDSERRFDILIMGSYYQTHQKCEKIDIASRILER